MKRTRKPAHKPVSRMDHTLELSLARERILTLEEQVKKLTRVVEHLANNRLEKIERKGTWTYDERDALNEFLGRNV